MESSKTGGTYACNFSKRRLAEGTRDETQSDARYGEVAKNWEGDLIIVIEPQGNLKERLNIYFDLWHGKCRRVEYAVDPAKYPNPVFTLTATYHDITKIVTGKLNPMTAMMTNKLRVKGSLGYMMRNVRS